MKLDIVIVIFGRLIDYLYNFLNFFFRNIEILVLDEVDRYDINCFICLFFFFFMYFLFLI